MKFRVFDKVLNYYPNQEGFHIDNNFVFCKITYNRGLAKYELEDLDQDTYIVEYYSIRKDREGTLICVGDILTRYKKSGAAYKNDRMVSFNGQYFEGLECCDECEITGNIHEPIQ